MMDPIIVGRADGTWAIYFVPTKARLVSHSLATHGYQFDKTERAKVSGGLPFVLERVPVTFPTRDAAFASLRRAT